MRITVVGAAGGEVTGSCYIVQAKRAQILIDCSLFQGGKKCEALNRPPTAPNLTVDATLARLIQQGHRLASKLPKMGEFIEV